MFRDFIVFPETFAESLTPILGVIGGLVALAVVGALLLGALAVLTPQTQSVR